MNVIHPDPQEYAAARAGVVIHRFRRGVVRGTGTDRLDLLHRLSTNATHDLAPGAETTTILTSEKGRVIEVVRVIALDDAILMLLSGEDAERVRTWLDKYTIMDDFATIDVSGEYVVAGVYGDHAKSTLEQVLGTAMPDAGAAVRIALVDAGEIIALRDNRLTGAGGFLLLIPASSADSVFAGLAAAGVPEIGNDTYEVLRVEAGLPAIGAELSETYNPLEAGLSQFISWTKGCYIGQEVIARLDTYDKVQRHLVGLDFGGSVEEVVNGSGPLSAGGSLSGDGALDVRDPADGKKIGAVTSPAFSPAMNRTIALGYVRTNFAVPGAAVEIVPAVEGAAAIATAHITKLPFDR